MISSTWTALRPCCVASATMPAMSRMPVIPSSDRVNTLASSQKIMRCRMVPNTRASVPTCGVAACGLATGRVLRLPSVNQLAPPVEQLGHRLLGAAQVAQVAAHLDPQQLVADRVRDLLHARRK